MSNAIQLQWTYNQEEVSDLLEVAYIVEQLYDIEYLDKDERFRVLAQVYQEVSYVFDKDSESNQQRYGYIGEVLEDYSVSKPLIESILKEHSVPYEWKANY